MADRPDYERANGQPPPEHVEDAISAHDLVIEDLEEWATHYGVPRAWVEPVQAAMRERKEYGLRKYGEVLHPDNGRAHGVDAEEEALDLCAYLRTWIAQAEQLSAPLWRLYQDALWLLMCLRRKNATGDDLGYIDKARAAWPPHSFRHKISDQREH